MDDESTDPLRMSHGISDASRSTARETEEVEPLKTGCFDDGLEILDELVD